MLEMKVAEMPVGKVTETQMLDAAELESVVMKSAKLRAPKGTWFIRVQLAIEVQVIKDPD